MAEAARAFDENGSRNILHRGPSVVRDKDDLQCPWTKVRNGEIPPMMFQIRFNDGRMSSFAYSDVREVHCRDAGYIQLMLYSMRKIVITLEGRHLRDLANLFCAAAVKTIDEASPRDIDRPESAPEIHRIEIQAVEESQA